MRALTLCQPWATLVAIGAKAFETRSWQTAYRGDLAIHAGKRFPEEYAALFYERPFYSVLTAAGYERPSQLPLGAIVAIAELEDCLETRFLSRSVSATERAFGDFSPGRFAWCLGRPRRIDPPLYCRGAQGPWFVPPDIAAELTCRCVRP